jgi:S-adenosylmethionine synthetase
VRFKNKKSIKANACMRATVSVCGWREEEETGQKVESCKMKSVIGEQPPQLQHSVQLVGPQLE